MYFDPCEQGKVSNVGREDKVSTSPITKSRVLVQNYDASEQKIHDMGSPLQ